MGFNIKGALAGGVTGFLVGGPTGAAIGAGAGGFLTGDDDGAGVSFQGIPQTQQAEAATGRLAGLAAGAPPDVPRREIAPLPQRTEERDLARTTAKELIQPQDFLSLPEVQGIILEATQSGNLLANRLGRMLQAAGALTSTPGRDILGRVVTDVQKNLASSLAPFAQEERARRERLIPRLESLGLTEEERERLVTQAELDASFQQKLTESQQLQTFTIPLLKAIIGLQPGILPIIEGDQGTTSLESLSGIIGPLSASGGGSDLLASLGGLLFGGGKVLANQSTTGPAGFGTGTARA